MNTLLKSRIKIHELKLLVNLGWPKTERIKKQKVFVDIIIDFPEPPLGCVTDNLKDTFCYDEIIKKIQNTIESREFHLVEYLSHEIYQAIKPALSNAKINILVQKKPALLMSFMKNITFSYGDG